MEELYNSHLAKAGEEIYLIQGDAKEEELQMVRNINDLLECERDTIQSALQSYNG